MSRFYEMQVEVRDFDTTKKDAILTALQKLWPFDNTYETGEPVNYISVDGNGNLVAKREDEFAREVTRAVWDVNGAYCEVNVIATYLEDRPYNSYIEDKDDYETWKEEKIVEQSKEETETSS